MRTGHLSVDRQLARWYPLKDHPVQLALISAVDNGVRFPLVPAGRRSGKTERFKRFVVKQAYKVPGMYFAAAPTHNQAKKIFWQDLKDFALTKSLPKKPSESDLIIYLPNGSEIHVVGLDKPERFEGVPWTGGGIDEFANVKGHAWESNIYPALNTVDPRQPDFRAWAWLFGVPDGLNHFYDLCETVGNPDFQIFTWPSSDILPEDVIENAKKTMSPKQYRQEFEASFEGATGRIYEDYSSTNHTSEIIKSHEQLLWCHDFNFTPMSSGVGVLRGKDVYLLDEIILTSAVAKQSAMEFTEKFKDHENKNVIIYGDPSGRVGEKHGHISDYIEIENHLRDMGWKFLRKVKPKAPSIKDRQNAVRAKIQTASGDVSLYVNTAKAPYTHKGLATVQFKKGSTFLEDETEYQHITTAVGYMVAHEWPVDRQAMQNIGLGGI